MLIKNFSYFIGEKVFIHSEKQFRMDQSKRFSIGSVVLGLSALLIGSMTIIGGQDGAIVFGLAGFICGISLLIMGVGKYREWEGFSTVQ